MVKITDLIFKRKQRIAVLIDADNVPRGSIESMLNSVSQYGELRIIRAYGNWAAPIKAWKSTLIKHQIVPVHMYNSIVGKNSADILLVIDAMDLMYDNKVDIICIASSDSDFSRLATRIRESGIQVIFAGEKSKMKKNPSTADAKFIDITIATEYKNNKAKKISQIISDYSKKDDIAVISELITDIGNTSTIPGGWAFLGSVGHAIKKFKPDFTPMKYGFDSLSDFILSKPERYETFIKAGGATAPAGANYIYVRNKQPKPETI